MTKKLITFLSLIFLTSCQSFAQKEGEKTLKAKAASDRINSSGSNSEGILKGLDE